MNAKDQPNKSLSEWVDYRQMRGFYTFTRDEALVALKLSQMAFDRAISRLVVKKRLARIYRGFYAIIPLEHRAAGILPPDWFINDLMKYIKRPFYVGVLSAAAYHGASHQKIQVYHVVTDRSMRDIRCRGVAIRFFRKTNIAATPCEQMKGYAGYLPVSTPEATALDVVRYYRRAGGLGRVLTVLQELHEKIDPRRLIQAAKTDDCLSCAQRLGWLLEQTEFAGKATKFHDWMAKQAPLPVRLNPSLPIKGSKRDKRWNVWLNTDVEGDLT
jgi:predicted transcriptional regulator of viral defense system